MPCKGSKGNKNTGRAGPVQFRHQYLDMSDVKVAASNYTRAGHTCKPAMGFSFAAGTTDGGSSILQVSLCHGMSWDQVFLVTPLQIQ